MSLNNDFISVDSSNTNPFGFIHEVLSSLNNLNIQYKGELDEEMKKYIDYFEETIQKEGDVLIHNNEKDDHNSNANEKKKYGTWHKSGKQDEKLDSKEDQKFLETVHRKRKSDEGVTELRRLSDNSNGSFKKIKQATAEDYVEEISELTVVEIKNKLKLRKIDLGKKYVKKQQLVQLLCKALASEENDKRLNEENILVKSNKKNDSESCDNHHSEIEPNDIKKENNRVSTNISTKLQEVKDGKNDSTEIKLVSTAFSEKKDSMPLKSLDPEELNKLSKHIKKDETEIQNLTSVNNKRLSISMPLDSAQLAIAKSKASLKKNSLSINKSMSDTTTDSKIIESNLTKDEQQRLSPKSNEIDGNILIKSPEKQQIETKSNASESPVSINKEEMEKNDIEALSRKNSTEEMLTNEEDIKRRKLSSEYDSPTKLMREQKIETPPNSPPKEEPAILQNILNQNSMVEKEIYGSDSNLKTPMLPTLSVSAVSNNNSTALNITRMDTSPQKLDDMIMQNQDKKKEKDDENQHLKDKNNLLSIKTTQDDQAGDIENLSFSKQTYQKRQSSPARVNSIKKSEEERDEDINLQRSDNKIEGLKKEMEDRLRRMSQVLPSKSSSSSMLTSKERDELIIREESQKMREEARKKTAQKRQEQIQATKSMSKVNNTAVKEESSTVERSNATFFDKTATKYNSSTTSLKVTDKNISNSVYNKSSEQISYQQQKKETTLSQEPSSKNFTKKHQPLSRLPSSNSSNNSLLSSATKLNSSKQQDSIRLAKDKSSKLPALKEAERNRKMMEQKEKERMESNARFQQKLKSKKLQPPSTISSNLSTNNNNNNYSNIQETTSINSSNQENINTNILEKQQPSHKKETVSLLASSSKSSNLPKMQNSKQNVSKLKENNNSNSSLSSAISHSSSSVKSSLSNSPTKKESSDNKWKAQNNYEISDKGSSSSESDSDSDSDDEKVRKKVPDWAKKSNLLRALQEQYHGSNRPDPDDIFGEIPACNLEIIFGSNKNRYRQRGSSGMWDRDGLTVKERRNYRRDVGLE